MAHRFFCDSGEKTAKIDDFEVKTSKEFRVDFYDEKTNKPFPMPLVTLKFEADVTMRDDIAGTIIETTDGKLHYHDISEVKNNE